MNNLNFKIIEVEDATIAVVETQSISQELIDQFLLSPSDKATLSNIRNSKRRKEWLASRILLQGILNQYPQIHYQNSGKPILEDRSHHISITHSKNHIAVIASKTKEVALDIEDSQRRIAHLESKYINSKEQIIDSDDYFKIWCAKESIFKLLDYSNIELKSETTTNLQNKTITFSRTNETFSIQFIRFKDDILCYIIR
ncbi:4'-phosphopantetheinyl transferase superfamily protein [Prolixibacteraceae bacterium]|nr:4'-phosphopantetheinyl transferase superfamily protein [Prolixibacteraceae bacterium]